MPKVIAQRPAIGSWTWSRDCRLLERWLYSSLDGSSGARQNIPWDLQMVTVRVSIKSIRNKLKIAKKMEIENVLH